MAGPHKSSQTGPTRTARALVAPVCLFLLLLHAPFALGGVRNTGRWTSGSPWDWTHTAIHMILLPGDTAYHSRLLWWEDHGATAFAGGMWGWQPGTNQDCLSAASSGFSALSTGTAGPDYNMFCAGHAHLKDKRVLIAGGTESGEIGVRDALIFDPDASGDKWQSVSNMEEARWYPTATRLPSGQLTVTSGSTYALMHLYGGTATGTASAPDDSLRRIGLPRYGAWQPPVDEMPAGTNSTVNGWPARVIDARFVWAEGLRGYATYFGRSHSRALLFGGDSLNFADEWISHHETRLFAAEDRRGAEDEGYVWDKRQPLAGVASELPRAGHVVVSCPPPTSGYPGNEPGWIVFGGRRTTSGPDVTYLDDVWHLANDSTVHLSTAISYRWRTKDQGLTIVNPELAPSSKRYGAAGFYDPQHRRVLIFGGSADGASPVANDSVYALTISATTDTMSWSRILPSAPTGARPRSRFGHGMLFDNIGRRRKHAADPDEHYYRGILFGGRTADHADSLSNQLWSLWIDPKDAANLEWRFIPYEDSTAPPQTAFGIFVKDDYSDRLVVFGGDATGTPDPRPWAIPLPIGGGHHAASGYEWADEPSYGTGTYKWSPEPQRFGVDGEADASRTGAAAIVYAKPSFARHTERYGADGSGPTTLTNAVLRQEWYPFNFVLPDGSLFTCGPTVGDADSSYRNANPAADSAWRPCPTGSNRIGFNPGSAAMYRPGRILVAGSNDLHAGQAASTASRWIVVDSATAAWNASINPMRSNRANHNLVILPNGQILAVGGTGEVDRNDQPRKRPELWDPLAYDADSARYGRWYDTINSESLAVQAQVRGYHSTALLLPDGRVLSAGGNNDPSGEQVAEIYCPPYLFNALGNPAARPSFSTAPTEVTYGQTMRVCASHSGTSEVLTACLIAPAATTHGFDQNQRYVPLTVTHVCGSTYDISTPANANLAPPGYYLFFVLNNLGVPSVARWLLVRDGTPPTLPTCSAGCTGGCPKVDTWTAGGWQVENTILARSTAGSLEPDAYRLKAAPEVRDGRVTLRLRENEQEVTTLDEIALLAVDHSPGSVVLGAGAEAVTGTRTPADRVTTSSGEDVTALLDGGSGWRGGPGDTLLVTFGAPTGGRFSVSGTQEGGGASGGAGDKEYELRWDPSGSGGTEAAREGVAPATPTDAMWLERTGIRIQVPDEVGGWQELVHWYPREQPDDTYFPALVHRQARLVFVGSHRLTFFGRLQPSTGATSAALAPLTAAHSRLGDVGTAIVAGGAVTELVPGDTVTVTFAVPPLTEGLVRDYVLVTRGVYTSDLSRARQIPLAPAPPARFELMQNVPNPFAFTTAIEFRMPRAGRVTLEVFDLLGRRVRTLTDARWPAGSHRVEWDRRTDGGRVLRSGVYLYRMTTDGFRDQKKLVIGVR